MSRRSTPDRSPFSPQVRSTEDKGSNRSPRMEARSVSQMRSQANRESVHRASSTDPTALPVPDRSGPEAPKHSASRLNREIDFSSSTCSCPRTTSSLARTVTESSSSRPDRHPASTTSHLDLGCRYRSQPGTGLDQVQRQSGANTGAADSDATVRLAPDTFNNLPPVEDIIRVTISSR